MKDCGSALSDVGELASGARVQVSLVPGCPLDPKTSKLSGIQGNRNFVQSRNEPRCAPIVGCLELPQILS